MFSEPDQPKESKTNNFHFRRSISFAEHNEAQFLIHKYIFLFVDFHVPLRNQSISTTDEISKEILQWFNSPELSKQFEVWTHNQDLVKTMGLGVTSLSWRRWGKGETWGNMVRKCEGGAMKRFMLLWLKKVRGLWLHTWSWSTCQGLTLFVCLFKTPEFEIIWQVSCLETSELFRCLGLSLLFHSCRTQALSEHHGGPERVKDSWGELG